MANIQNTLTFNSGFNITAQAPLDSRTRVATLADLTDSSSWDMSKFPPYNGMIVAVMETGQLYVLVDESNPYDLASWVSSANSEEFSALLERVSETEDKVTQNTALITATAEEIRTELTQVETDLETQISSTEKTILDQTAEQISLLATKEELGETEKQLQSEITTTAESINLSVAEKVNDLNGKIETNTASINLQAGQIESAAKSITDINGTLTEHQTQITQNATDITSVAQTVTEQGTEISTVKQTASELSSTVEKIDGDLTTAKSEIKQNADNITATVSRVGELETSTATLTQRADSIEATVTSNKQELDGKITETESSVKQYADGIKTEISETIDGVTDKVTTVETNLDGITQRVTAVEEVAGNAATKTEVSEIKQTADQISLTVTSHTEQIGTLNDTTGNLENRVSTTEASITEMEGEIELKASQSDLTELENTVGTHATKIEENTSQININTESINSKVSQTTFDALESDVNALGDEVAANTAIISTQQTQINQNATAIEAKVETSTFDAYTGGVANQFTTVTTDIEGVKTRIGNAEGNITTINESISGITASLGTAEANIESLQKQYDGAIDTHFGEVDPTTDNEPAVNWNTTELKIQHTGDLYYNTATGAAWRYLYAEDGSESWTAITDEGLLKALDSIKTLTEEINGKVTIFYIQPTSYKYGDIWFVEKDYTHDEILVKENSIMVANGLTSGTSVTAFDWSHWNLKGDIVKSLEDLDETSRKIFADGIVTEAEKTTFSESLKSFEATYKELSAAYTILTSTDFETNSTLVSAKSALDSAYNDLVTEINAIIDGSKDSQTDYTDAYNKYVTALEAYNKAVAEVTESIQVKASSASEYVSDIAADGKLTPIEKKQLLGIWKGIAEEFNANKGIAVNYKIINSDGSIRTDIYDTVAHGNAYYPIYETYNTAYDAVANIFTSDIWGWANITETTTLTDVNVSGIDTALNDYYAALTNFSEMISKITIEITDAHEKVKETVDALAEHLSPEDNITVVGKGVVLSTVIGVQSGGELKAAINASDLAAVTDEKHGRVVFAGGIDDSNWNDSTTVIYEDGHVKMKSGEISESVSIGGAVLAKAKDDDASILEIITINDVPLFQVNKAADGTITSIYTTFPFYSTQSISALGLQEDGGSSSGGASYLSDLYDVSLTDLASGHLLYYNGSKWVNKSESELVPDLTGYATESWVSNKLASYALSSTVSSNTSSIGTLQGYFSNGVAKQAAKTTGILTINVNGTETTFNGSADSSVTINKSAIGLGNVTNLAATGYLTALGSNITNAVSITVGGTTKTITTDTLKTSLGLKALAYKDSIAFDDLSEHPTTISDYGITNAYTKTEIDNKTTSINNAIATNTSSIAGLSTELSNLRDEAVLLAGEQTIVGKKTFSDVVISGQLRLSGSGSGNPQIYGNGSQLVIGYSNSTAYGCVVLESNTFRRAISSTAITLGTSSYTWPNAYIQNISANYTAATSLPFLYVGSNNQDITLLRVYSSDHTDSNYVGTFGYSLKYLGTGSGNTNYLNLYADNQSSTSQALGLSMDQAGNVGVGNIASSNYKFYVSGNTFLAGTSYTHSLYSTTKGVLGNSSYPWASITLGSSSSNYVTISYDSTNNCIKIDGDLYATGSISAGGYQSEEGTGTGASYDRLDSWDDYTSSMSGYVLSAGLGYDLNTRVNSLENGSATDITTTGSGNVVTSVTKSGTTITVNKGITALTAHQSIYTLTINNSAGTAQVTYTPNSAKASLTLTKDMVGLGNVQNTAFYERQVAVNGGVHRLAGPVTGNGFTIYAPTAAGTSGYWLKSNGSGAPTWDSMANLKSSLGLGSNAYTSTAYLPLAGGTIDGSLQIGADDNTSFKYLIFSRVSHAMRLNNTGKAGYISFGTYSGGAYTAEKIFEIGDYGLRYSANGDSTYNDIIHSGNIGSQFVEGIGTVYANQSINFGREGKVRMIYGTASNSIDLGYPLQYASGLSVVTGYTGWQMVTYGGTTLPNPYFRKIDDNDNWSDWKQLAFLTDNVASATKLATARTIWGQSFDGTGNVSGALSGVTTISASGSVTTGGSYKFSGTSTSYNSDSIELYGPTPFIDFHYDSSTADYTSRIIEGLSGQLTVTGKLRVGLSYTTSTDYDFHVNGSAYATTATIATANITTLEGTAVTTINNAIATNASAITSLNTDLSNLRDESVLLAGAQTIVGSKTFTAATTFSGTVTNKSTTYFGDTSYYVTSSGGAKFGTTTTGSLTATGTLSVTGTSTFTALTTHSSGLVIAPKTAISFKDSTGTLHELTYDETSKAFKFDGNVYATAGISAGGYQSSESTATDSVSEVSLAWGSGTTAGPTLTATVDGVSSSAAAIPIASTSVSGVVSTGTQTFTGIKIFSSNVYIGNATSRYLYFGSANNFIYGLYSSTASSTAMTIRSGGQIKFNIGETQVGYWNTSALYSTGGFYESSDERLKNFCGEIPIDLDAIRSLSKKYFTWKSDSEGKLQIGTSAQEVRKLYPELVTEGSDGYLTVAYDKLSIVALRAFDKLYDKYVELEKRVKQLEDGKEY